MSYQSINVTVEGTPVPQGSMRAYVRGGKPVIVHDKPELKTWRDKIRLTVYAEAKRQGVQLPLGKNKNPVGVEAAFYFKRPKTVKKGKKLVSVKPDLDKLLRAVGDALGEPGAYQIIENDSRIVYIRGGKYYTDDKPRLILSIEEEVWLTEKE